MKIQISKDTSIYAATMKRVMLYFTSLILVTLIKADEVQDIPQSTLPEVYLPEDCDVVHLNGFSQAVIISQRGDRYPANYNCKVRITLHGNFFVQFMFEKMDLASPNSDGRCVDSVQFFNQVGQSYVPMTDRLCGSKIPFAQLTSNSSSAMLVFSTDSYQEKTGFRIKYDRVPNNNPSTGGNTGAATGCFPGRLCSTNSASSFGSERSKQQAVMTMLMMSLVSFFVYRWNST